jgi:hypothetical protein
MLMAAGLRPPERKGKNMRVRILLILSAALLLSVGVATAAAGKSTASKQLCASYGGTYSTKEKSSFFRPFSKHQKMLWSCNSYSGGSTATQALIASCSNDGGQATSTLDGPPGLATCWKNAAV